MTWHDTFKNVKPEGPVIVIAQELFDALPVHIFRYKHRKPRDPAWSEVLVDEDQTAGPAHLRYVLAPHPTAASKALAKWLPKMTVDGETIQVSVESMELVDMIGKRIVENGGAMLVIDYGQDSRLGDTVVALRNHDKIHPLQEPGVHFEQSISDPTTS